MRSILWVIAAVAVASSCRAAESAAIETVAKHAAKFEKEIAAFEQADAKSPPPKDAVLFVGDSAIRMWKSLASDFPEYRVINRGFGGSILADSVYFADRVVIPYHPRLIVVKAGGNDLAAGKTPEQITGDFEQFVQTVRAKLPDVRIAYQSTNPNVARWNQKPQRLKTNELIQAIVAKGANLDFIKVWNPYLDAQGNPRPDLFIKDGMHFNEAGYKVLADIVRPHLKEPAESHK